ncbi:MAG: hypothetical protein H7228_02875, partial [Polaromonas sp.]|nr:hypothetical protein [Polaromonas sp.]
MNTPTTSHAGSAPATPTKSPVSRTASGSNILNKSSKASTSTSSNNTATAKLKITYLKVKVAGGKTLTYIFRPRKRLSALLSWLLSSLVATVSGHAYAL